MRRTAKLRLDASGAALANLHARLPRTLYHRLRLACRRRDCRICDYVTDAVREHLTTTKRPA